MAKNLWIVGDDLATDFSSMHKEIRAIDSRDLQAMIKALNIFDHIEVLGRDSIAGMSAPKIITASESISQKITEKYFPHAEMVVDSVFLRYDQSNVKTLRPVEFDRESRDPFDQAMMRLAFNEADKSSDWWRHVGAVLSKGETVITTAHNEPVPSEHMPYVFGNPRDFIEAGTLSAFSDALHAETALFAYALDHGISTRGADIRVSVFPCPGCAKLIAYSGIRRCFFGSGHASLDGQRVLKSRGVELIYVPLEPRI